ncbi:MAG: fibronectin/fibrinogen-binding protein, partial [Clostridiaceae bacterium]|nr:fibronectin/fibrinogen-binding protein [Clostridiaceae bacterium]
DEVLMTIRAKGQNIKLVISANANNPRIHITEASKENPQVPPVFCMLLRKHLSGGRINGIEFHDYERIITMYVENISELGDYTLKKLIIEIMGKHSNIILLNNEDKIIDSIKHVDSEISRIREIMPARLYMLPPPQEKTSPENLEVDLLFENMQTQDSVRISRYLLNNIKGFSPLLCEEICYLAGVDGRTATSDLSLNMIEKLKHKTAEMIEKIINSDFQPNIIWSGQEHEKPIDFHSLQLKQFADVRFVDSISEALDIFYSARDNVERLTQKKSDITKALNNNLERCRKKLSIHNDKLREVADREQYKLFGELITANIYCIPRNTDKVSLLNYYSQNNEYVEVPLDETISPQENAQRYFRRYSKAKSAYTFTCEQLSETKKELEYLESVLHNLETSSSLKEIEEIREELIGQEYILSRKKSSGKKGVKPSSPYLYKSSDGLDIYVGKNNLQNDALTLKFASSNDMWLHTKNIPGSHVIIKKIKGDIPDKTLYEAAVLAAYHSKGQMSSHVEVDYTQVKNVKKPSGAKPGMVIYNNFKTIVVTPDIHIIEELKNK